MAAFAAIVGGDAPARNVVSGNCGIGIALSGGSENHVVGNFIGTDASGTRTVPNGEDGVQSSSDQGTITGNVISGNSMLGIELISADFNVIDGNRIGTDVTGTVALPNQAGGMDLGGVSNRIGGQTSEARNLISGNGGPGILIDGGFLFRTNSIWGNWIGVDATGTQRLGNQGHGVWAPWWEASTPRRGM